MRISDWSSDVCSSDLPRQGDDRDGDDESATHHQPARCRDHCFDWRARWSLGSGSRSGTVAAGATACGIFTEVAAFSSFDDAGDTGWTPSSSSGAPTAGYSPGPFPSVVAETLHSGPSTAPPPSPPPSHYPPTHAHHP